MNVVEKIIQALPTDTSEEFKQELRAKLEESELAFVGMQESSDMAFIPEPSPASKQFAELLDRVNQLSPTGMVEKVLEK